MEATVVFLPGDPYFFVYLIPVVVTFYLLRNNSLRVLFLLLVSLFYYASFSLAFFIPLFSVFALTYGGSLLIERMPDDGRRLAVFWLLVILILVPLASYKYIIPGAFLGATGTGYNWGLIPGQYAIPIGISYYTFAALGYLCDVHLRVIEADKRPDRIALYLSFFPHVTSGPIPRAPHFLPQLQQSVSFNADQMMIGIRLMLVGACMKLWLADSLSSSVNLVYQNPSGASALENLLASGIFAYQLYADFAGYSLIAIGAARLFGIVLGDNFRQPFLSPTLPEFWRSWHISLFTWMRDYVFTPLRIEWRSWPATGSSVAIIITLTLVGIWHGTGWGFLAYGVVHGVLLAASMYTLPWRNAFWQRLNVPAAPLNFLRILTTFSIVALTLVLIRSKDLSQALAIYKIIFSPSLFTDIFSFAKTSRILTLDTQLTNFILIGVIVIGDILAKSRVDFDRAPKLTQVFVYSICILAIMYQAISANASKPFIYFQF